MSFLVLDMLKKRYIGLIKSHEDFFLKYKTKTVKIEQNKLPVFFCCCCFFSFGVYCSRVYSTQFTVHAISQCPVEKLVRTTPLKGYVICPIFCQYVPFKNFKVTLFTKNAARPLLKQAIKGWNYKAFHMQRALRNATPIPLSFVYGKLMTVVIEESW